MNLKYGNDPGVTLYTHISDQYAPFHTKVINAALRGATHVLSMAFSITSLTCGSRSITLIRPALTLPSECVSLSSAVMRRYIFS
jgi:Tn3 transposase DDE domain